MIVVTGATGLVGSHLLINLLENNKNVWAIYQNEKSIEKTKRVFLENKNTNFDNIIWLETSVLDLPKLNEAFRNAEFVYHCAAVVSFDPNDEEILRKTNIEGTANVVNCCLANNVKKLCFVSSIAALGDLLPNETIYSEKTEWNPEINHSDYAISKYGAETEVWRGFYEGLQMVIVNPGVIIAPLYWKIGSGEIAQKVKKGLQFHSKGITGFVALPDVIKAMVALMNSPISGERFVIVAENLSYFELLKLYAIRLKKPIPKFYLNPFLSKIIYILDWFLNVFGKKRLLSKDLLQALHSKVIYESTKIKSTLNFSFEPIESFINRL